MLARLLGLFMLISISAVAVGQVRVSGYYRKDGTYVRPHQRTAPNNTVTDNYSYPGNYNPNTGQVTGGYPSAAPSSAYEPSTGTIPTPQITRSSLPTTGNIQLSTSQYNHCYGNCNDAGIINKTASITIGQHVITVRADGVSKEYQIESIGSLTDTNLGGNFHYINVTDGSRKLMATYYEYKRERVEGATMKRVTESRTGLNLIDYATQEKHCYSTFDTKTSSW